MAKNQPTAKAGKLLGRYRIERELGRGGMGIVYLARDENLQRRVALKTTSVAGLGSGERSRNQRRQRFIREVQALAQVNHDHVVHVYDAGEQDDPDLGWLLFYSMQFVDGITLAQLVQERGPMDPAAAAAVCMQVASGLGAAHHKNIVHRDVKPANIFLTADRRALIGDFGICKIEGSTQITRRDQLVGTPNYLAPEQILGDPVTPATDVFALAALFYVVTTNRPLRTKVDAASLLRSANSNEAKEKVQREKRIPSGLRSVIARALERDAARRYPDGDAFADALSDHASRVPALGPEPTGPVTPALRAMSTDTDPFAPIQRDEPEPRDQSAMSAVEQAAQALLNEVGSTRTSPPGPADEALSEKLDGPLPEAQTESTAMFNLRSYEKEKKKQSEMAVLPIAKTESTVLFKLHQDKPSDPLAGDTADSFTYSADTEVKERAQPRREAKKERKPKPDKPLPPLDKRRVQQLGVTAGGAAGLALFLVVLLYVLLTPSRPVIPPPRLGAFTTTTATAQAVPAECGSTAATDAARRLANEKVEEALRLGRKAPARKLAQLYRQALESDGHNHRAHYFLATIVARDDEERSRAHYRCVVALDPEGELGRRAKAVLSR